VTPTSAAGSGSSRRARRAAALPSRLAPEIDRNKPPAAEDPRPPGATREPPSGDELPPSLAPTFAHASEAEMARILDFYEVRWEYEPHTFPILWNVDGMVVESFSPDFWLPDLDLYLEMTTLRQRLVRKKNRKLRRVLELYPDLRVKLFYARDFRALMLKFGKLALIDEMSGTPGQVIPERIAAEVADAAAAAGQAEGASGLGDPFVEPPAER
jgi:hypoxanthine phosphoribosyltransferase